MNIVVLDYARLPDNVDFPPLVAARYSWEQYPKLQGESLLERCWRADVIVSFGSGLDIDQISVLPKLKLIVVADIAAKHQDLDAAATHDVKVAHCREGGISDPTSAELLCQQITNVTDAFIRGELLDILV